MKKIILLTAIAVLTIASCKKKEEPKVYGCMDTTADNFDSNATDDDGTCTYTDTTTFPVDVNLMSSIDFNHNNSNLKISLSEIGGSMETEQTLSGSDIGATGQNYFSARLTVGKSYLAKVVDLDDFSYSIFQGDTIFTYNTILQTAIQITIESWGYDSNGYYKDGWSSELNFAGQADLNGNYTGGSFRIQIKI